MPARVVNLTDPNLSIPEFLILDASVILELLDNNPQPTSRHRAIIQFFKRTSPLVQKGDLMLFLSLFALEECCFIICRGVIEQYKKSINSPHLWHTIYKRSPNIINSAQNGVRELYRILKAIHIEIMEPEDTAKQPKGALTEISTTMQQNIFKYHLLPKDAVILSEAQRLGINTVMSLDKDWQRADGFTLITYNQN